MRRILKNDKFLDLLNKESSIYKCPICKKDDWSIFSKEIIDNDNIGTFGYAAYIIAGDKTSPAIYTKPIVFALAICQNCGFIATFDENTLLKRIEQKNQNDKRNDSDEKQ